MRIPVVVFVLACAGGGAAHAAPKKIAAELLCGTINPKGDVKAPVRSGVRTGQIIERVACAIHLRDPHEDAHMGTIKTIRHVVDPATGKRRDVAGTTMTTDFGPGSDRADLELVLRNGQPMDDQSVAFTTCEDFDVIGTISDDRGVYFTSTIKVVQGCPAAKPLKGTLTCWFVGKDGKRDKITAKNLERPPGLASVACELDSKDVRLSDEDAVLASHATWTQYNDDGTTAAKRSEGTGDRNLPGLGAPMRGVFNLPADGWPNCQDVDLVITVGGGPAAIFERKVHTTITCGE
jgi:hypothetical protein